MFVISLLGAKGSSSKDKCLLQSKIYLVGLTMVNIHKQTRGLLGCILSGGSLKCMQVEGNQKLNYVNFL